MDPQYRRTVRSFVRRRGRLTAAQGRALAANAERLLRAGGEPLDLTAEFGRRAPVWLEIGFGNGDTLAELAASHPECDFLGVEVHEPGIGHLLLSIERRALGNVRIAWAEAREFIEQRLTDATLARILLLFPDPWPKKRHHKRRLLQPAFAATLAAKLEPGGVLHAATDSAEYAAQMLETLDALAPLRNLAGAGRYAERPAYRIPTRFEQRGLRLGHTVYDLLFARR